MVDEAHDIRGVNTALFKNRVKLAEDGASIWLVTPRNENPLEPGNYYVVSDGKFLLHLIHRQAVAKFTDRSIGPVVLNNEPCLTRTISLASSTRNISFRNAVRERDQECTISRVNNEMYGWIGIQATPRLSACLSGLLK